MLDRDDTHVYQPGLLFLPFGAYRDSEVDDRRIHAPIRQGVSKRLRVCDGRRQLACKARRTLGLTPLIRAVILQITHDRVELRVSNRR